MEGIDIAPAIRARQWEWIIDTLKASCNPKASASQVDSTGKLPLHLALFNNAPHNVIAALVRAYPEACRRKDAGGRRLPLHVAILCDSDILCVKKLLEAYPEACFVPDPIGVLPLKAAQVRASARLHTVSSALRQDLEQLQLSALFARAEATGHDLDWHTVDASPKQEQRRTLVAHLMESELLLKQMRLDKVVAALSAVVESHRRVASRELRPEAYEYKDGRLGGGTDGERSTHTLLDAMARCTSLTWAVGFAYQGPVDPSPVELLNCIFFRTIDQDPDPDRLDQAQDRQWQTYLKVVQETLSPSMDDYARAQRAMGKKALKKQRQRARQHQERDDGDWG